MRINDDSIEFQFPEQAPRKISIAYRGRAVDKDGYPVIRDYMVEAVMYFICYNFDIAIYSKAQYSERCVISQLEIY
jgi:hypothetical protein